METSNVIYSDAGNIEYSIANTGQQLKWMPANVVLRENGRLLLSKQGSSAGKPVDFHLRSIRAIHSPSTTQVRLFHQESKDLIDLDDDCLC